MLEKADASPALARAIVHAIAIEIAGGQDALATKHEVTALRAEVRAVCAELKADVHQAISGFTRQMYIAFLAQTAVILSFGYFLATQLR